MTKQQRAELIADALGAAENYESTNGNVVSILQGCAEALKLPSGDGIMPDEMWAQYRTVISQMIPAVDAQITRIVLSGMLVEIERLRAYRAAIEGGE